MIDCSDCKSSTTGRCWKHPLYENVGSTTLIVNYFTSLKEKYFLKLPGNKSIEHLSHFNCPYCHKWFSIGDAPLDRKEWTCPWCHKIAEYGIK